MLIVNEGFTSRKAGIQPKDIVTQVNHHSVVGKPLIKLLKWSAVKKEHMLL